MARPSPAPTLRARSAPLRDASDARRRTLSIVVFPAPDEEGLIRRLALDRLRDLHDDGVTADYMGRMYGVSGARIRAVERRLRRRR